MDILRFSAVLLLSGSLYGGQTFLVKIINRESNEGVYSYTSAATSQTNVKANVDCSTYPNSVNCAGSATSTTTSRPAREFSFNLTGATLSLQLPDGRIAVVNCQSKVNWTDFSQGPRRSCKIPPMDEVKAEFNGDNAKLKWSVSIDGKKMQDETYKILKVIPEP